MYNDLSINVRSTQRCFVGATYRYFASDLTSSTEGNPPNFFDPSLDGSGISQPITSLSPVAVFVFLAAAAGAGVVAADGFFDGYGLRLDGGVFPCGGSVATRVDAVGGLG